MKLFSIVAGLLISLSAQATSIEVRNVSVGTNAEDYLSLNFGLVNVGIRYVEHFRIRNTGAVPLQFRDTYIYGMDFSASHSCRDGLLPNQICYFDIAYWPMFEGMNSGRFVLNFVSDQVVVDLWGEARRF